ncbi:MAG TPA: aminomethyl-transferring glycine dehydrogenase subunit GcvPB [Methylocella sp.]|nr:aminomethyl-transferring glycine dehydrogenase subunit GcvPB [Methylocella sp.]
MLMRQGQFPKASEAAAKEAKTFTGNRGLDIEEGLIFETGRPENTGVDLAEPLPVMPRLGALKRKEPAGLPGLSEPEAVRHYVRLSRMNYSIDAGIFPLGSCTMKHNPRLNEAMARLQGFADIHPLQPESTVQGALELMAELSRWLMVLTGMDAVALAPRAGAHGEACGLMIIKAAIAAKGEAQSRNVVLVPESAHGTNPASATSTGFEVRPVPARSSGTLDPAEVKKRLGPEVAAIMLTNPNTCGLFEKDTVEIASMVHAAGAYFYCDGANFNAIMGKARPGDLGADAMHINLHKTFSTPHGGGGPGAGPVVLSSRLAPFAPVPFVRREGDAFRLVEHCSEAPQASGRIAAFHGQMGTFVRALAYMLSHGAEGLRQAAEDAVLSANYVRVSLKDVMSGPYTGQVCMHEALFDESWLAPAGLTAFDFAKAMIDEGFHPMTVYFPLVTHGAMLIEPTESESKASLDLFIAALRDLALAAKRGDRARFAGAPRHAPRCRLDETRAARHPVLKWTKPQPA